MPCATLIGISQLQRLPSLYALLNIGTAELWPALSALTWQVVIPVEVPGHGPLGISLLGLPKSDAALVMAAAKLGPLIADNIVALGQKASAGQPSSRLAARAELCPAADAFKLSRVSSSP